MDDHLLRQGLEEAAREIAEIDGRILSLQDRRRTLLDYVRVTRGLLGEADDVRPGRIPATEGGRTTPPPLPRGTEGDLDAGTAKRMRSERRRYMQSLVDETVRILSRERHPLMIDEIHDLHPERPNVDRDLLYHTLHKRVQLGRQVTFDRGYFWLVDADEPEGWVHPKGPRVPVGRSAP